MGLYGHREPIYLTVDEVAEQLRVHRRTVRRLLVARRLPGLKVGRGWRVPAQAMRELLDGKANRDAIQRYCDENREIVAGLRGG